MSNQGWLSKNFKNEDQQKRGSTSDSSSSYVDRCADGQIRTDMCHIDQLLPANLIDYGNQKNLTQIDHQSNDSVKKSPDYSCFSPLYMFSVPHAVYEQFELMRNGTPSSNGSYIHEKLPVYIAQDDGDVDDCKTLGYSSDVEIPKKSALVSLLESREPIPNTSNFYVLKISHLPITATSSDIAAKMNLQDNCRGHKAPYFTECVHFIIDRNTGISAGYAFVEFPSRTMALSALSLRPKWTEQGNPMIITKSSQAELMETLFPHFKIVLDPWLEQKDIHSGTIYITRQEITKLLTVCRSIKNSSKPKRKLAERAFENIISILSKVPWHKAAEMSTLQRDHLFEMTKLSVEAIMFTRKPTNHSVICSRILRAAMCVPLFTQKQKEMLLDTARCPCPDDLNIFVITVQVEVEDPKVEHRKPDITPLGVNRLFSFLTPPSTPSDMKRSNVNRFQEQANSPARNTGALSKTAWESISIIEELAECKKKISLLELELAHKSPPGPGAAGPPPPPSPGSGHK